jgi:hypothetical protein
MSEVMEETSNMVLHSRNDEASNLLAFVSSNGFPSIITVVPKEENSSEVQRGRKTPDARLSTPKKPERGILKATNSIQSNKEKSVSIQEEKPAEDIAARSLSQKNYSDNFLKSSSSFNDKDKEIQNSIISEEDSAFEEQTPADINKN